MVCPTSTTQRSSFQFLQSQDSYFSSHQPNDGQPSFQSEETSASESGTAWELFSGQAQLKFLISQGHEEDLSDPVDFPVGFPSEMGIESFLLTPEEEQIITGKRKREVILDAVRQIFEDPFVLYTRHPTAQPEIEAYAILPYERRIGFF